MLTYITICKASHMVCHNRLEAEEIMRVLLMGVVNCGMASHYLANICQCFAEPRFILERRRYRLLQKRL